MSNEKIYIRRKTKMIIKGSTARSLITIECKQGSRGKWNVAGDDKGVYDFSNLRERENKIEELISNGAVLV